MQLTAAAVTPPAEHAARRPAGAADAAAADAGVIRTFGGRSGKIFAFLKRGFLSLEPSTGRAILRGPR
jgi:hypothetical protein